jgi:putative transposase
MLIKTAFSRGIAGDKARNPSRLRKGERGIWQRRYWKPLVRDAQDYEKLVDYIHYNPVKHGHAKRASE